MLQWLATIFVNYVWLCTPHTYNFDKKEIIKHMILVHMVLNQAQRPESNILIENHSDNLVFTWSEVTEP